MGRIKKEGGITPSFGDFYPLLVPESRESGRPPPCSQTHILCRRKMNPRAVLVEACKQKYGPELQPFASAPKASHGGSRASAEPRFGVRMPACQGRSQE